MNQNELFHDVNEQPNLGSYDVIVINSSAGKDSQAMLDHVVEQADAAGVRDRLVVLHCDLGLSPGGQEIEWPGTKELAAEHAAHYGLRFIVVQRGVRGFLEEIDYRGMFPANQQRYCTSKFKQDQGNKVITALADEARGEEPDPGFLEQIDRLGHWPRAETRNCTSTFKRDPGQKAINRLALEVIDQPPGPGFLEQIEDRGMFSDQDNRLCTSNNKRDPANTAITQLADEARDGSKRRPRILQCFGFRAQESSRRKKMRTFSIDKRTSNTRKEVNVWLPIHAWKVEQVWERIAAAGTRYHPAYDLGMSRLSCRFCIFAPRSQLILSARLNPELFQEYLDLETRIGHRFQHKLSLADIKAAVDAGEQGHEDGPDDGCWNM